MRILLNNKDLIDSKPKEKYDKFYDVCDICTLSGRVLETKNISLSHAKESFNVKIQIDFIFAYIKTSRFDIIKLFMLVPSTEKEHSQQIVWQSVRALLK